MAGKIQIFAGNSHPEFADKVAEHLGLKVSGPDVRDRKGKQVTMFSNGNLFVDIKRNVRDDNCFVIQTQAPNVSDHCMELFFLVRALKAAKARSVTAVMPYMPYIRSDKKDHARACIGARLFLDLLKESGVDRIIIMDPHFEQVHGFIDEKNVEVEIFRSKPVLAHHIRNSYDLSNAVVVMADIGGAKRSSSMVNLLGLKAAVIDKRRVDDSEEPVPAGIMGDVRGKDCFMFEDETASGKTLLVSAEYLVKECGARSVRVFVTHPVLSVMKGVAKLRQSPYIQEITVFDTIPVPAKKRMRKLKILSAARYFADIIRLVHIGESVDEYKHQLYEGLPNTETVNEW